MSTDTPPPASPKLILCFDVESVGLHGEAYAVGWVLLDSGAEIESGYAACQPGEVRGSKEDRAWIAANVPPIEPTHTPYGVREAFWSVWTEAKARGAILVADCAWPVEARFLAACIDDDREGRKWAGPYPLHDVASARLAAGLDPLATVDRLPSEEPKHHPTADARQSARLFLEALAALQSRLDAILVPPPGLEDARAALAEWDRDLIAYYGDVDRVGPGPEARHLRTALAHVAEQRSRLAELREERDRWEDRVTALRTEIEGVRRERDEVARNADCGAPAVPGSALCIVHKPARNP